jgi:two-component system, sensor histidine kinase and response regulator
VGLRVLYVEDNRLNQELVRDLLEAEGHLVELAGDGLAFRERVKAGDQPDIILMDILLPGVDGVTLLRELREAGRWGRVPVVAVTAQALSGDRQRLLEAGFHAVLEKPLDTRTFVHDVVRHAGSTEGQWQRS